MTSTAIPPAEEITEIEIRPFYPDGSHGGTVNEQRLRSLLRQAAIVDSDDRLLRDWHYAPWFDGSFRYEDRLYRFQFFLGWLGAITDPEGRTIHLIASKNVSKDRR